MFFVLLPAVNAPFDAVSIGVTRGLLRRGVVAKGFAPLGLSLLDGVIALGLLLVVIAALVLSVQVLNWASVAGGGAAALAFPVNDFLNDMRNPDTLAPYWVYGVVLSTFIPSAFNLIIGCLSLTRGFWGVPGCLYGFMPADAPVIGADRVWMPVVLAGQWVAGFGLSAGALLGLGWLGFSFADHVGLGLLDWASFVASWFGPAPP